MGKAAGARLLAQLSADVLLLRKLNIMDYSLLMVPHSTPHTAHRTALHCIITQHPASFLASLSFLAPLFASLTSSLWPLQGIHRTQLHEEHRCCGQAECQQHSHALGGEGGGKAGSGDGSEEEKDAESSDKGGGEEEEEGGEYADDEDEDQASSSSSGGGSSNSSKVGSKMDKMASWLREKREYYATLRRKELVADGQWLPDRSSSVCMNCQLPFTVRRRRHHCRVCGKLVCNKCSPFKLHVPSRAAAVRICHSCNFNSKIVVSLNPVHTAPFPLPCPHLAFVGCSPFHCAAVRLCVAGARGGVDVSLRPLLDGQPI